MKTKYELISDSVEVKREKVSGIYFLIDRGEIVYIGQSTDLQKRISHHVFSEKKRFSHYFTIPVPEEDLDRVEADYIWKFTPRYNKSIPTNSRYASIAVVMERFPNVTFQEISDLCDAHNIESRKHWYDLDSLLPVLEDYISRQK